MIVITLFEQQKVSMLLIVVFTFGCERLKVVHCKFQSLVCEFAVFSFFLATLKHNPQPRIAWKLPSLRKIH
jgi:hypothetical protein